PERSKFFSLVSCALVPAARDVRETAAEARVSRVFDRIERECARLFRGQSAVTDRFGAEWSRTYNGLDARLETHGGRAVLALLYPPNALFLVLPLALAVNWSIALNMWLLGAFMYLWGLRRGLHPVAAFACGALVMFCAPHFLHIYAGHLTNLAAMAWVPLIFLAIDEWLRSQRFGWCLLGMLGVAMQILAGHPQYVFYTALGAGIYSLARLAALAGPRLRAAGGLLSLHPGGALLAAAQLLVGIQTTSETIRGKPLPLTFTSQFPMPSE